MNDQGPPGPGWTVVLRRQPVRIVEGRALSFSPGGAMLRGPRPW